MSQEPSLSKIYDRYYDRSTGKTVFEATNFQNTLRNKIRAGISTEASKDPSPISPHPAQPTLSSSKEAASKAVPTFRSDTTPTSIGLVGSTMHTQSSSPSLQSWDVRYEINAPLSPYHTDLMEEKEAQSMISVAFCFNGEYKVTNIRQNCTVLELRHTLIQQGLFPSLQELTGWRLGLQGQLLNDSVGVYSLHFTRGIILEILLVEDNQEIHLPTRPFNSFNAATDRSPTDGRRYVRTIERFYNTQPLPETTREIPAVGEARIQQVIQEVQEIPYDYFPILQRPGYYMRPDHFEMRNMTEDEVKQVKNFVVGREGAGEICWPGETDVRCMNLDERVVIERDLNGVPYVLVYPPDVYLNVLPPEGEELNKRAEIQLFNMFPQGVRTDRAAARYETMLMQQVSAMGGEWISYDINKGVLKFAVNHF